ncbi:MAG: FHA domain-containing protein [Planctomycetaceae bacterium]
MTPAATITVTDGPDAGRAFPLSEDLVHIGRGADNQVVLSDGALAEHQASIVRRQGRFAIYSPAAGAVQVEGNDIPAERWVWLPRTAVIQLGVETILRLDCHETPAPGAADSTPTPLTGRSRSSPRKSDPERARRRGRNGEHRPQVARFINDRTGEPLVKLGEDGQLPALELAELAEEQPRERREARSTSPLLLYGVLAGSLVLSLLMLVVDPQSQSAAQRSDYAQARATLQQFYGDPQRELLPYQQLLRQALVAASQGDAAAEQDAYRQVLRMLNSSDIRDPRNVNGLTGRQTNRGRASDDDLREALLTLLSK